MNELKANANTNDLIGILDPTGAHNNPLTGEPYSDQYRELGRVWKEFPAYVEAKKIIDDIRNHQIVLLTSGTGSGKTVLLPKYVLHVLGYKGRVGITLPKQIIAESAATFAAKTLDVTLGKEVGYKFKGSPKEYYNSKNKLVYATDGTIVAQLMKDPLLIDYDAIVIDEAHERKIQIDFLLYLLKETCRKRTEFKLVIMSATVNEKVFGDYFEGMSFKHIEVGGRTNYPIKSHYLTQSVASDQYVAKGLEFIRKILGETDEGDILFFVTSIAETTEVCRQLMLGEEGSTIADRCWCVEVYAGMDPQKQEMAQDKTMYQMKFGKDRKVVIATNVAESSLTIDGIKYVIDSGYEISAIYDPETDCRTLMKGRITKAQVKQRMGRSGRTGPGICYHLYTKGDYEGMKDYPLPAIRTSNIYGECLRLLAIPSIGEVAKLEDVLRNFIEPPRENYVKFALIKLMQLGLVRNDRITELGRIVSKTQLDPTQGLALYAGHHLKCSQEVIAIIAMLDALKGNLNDLFRIPIEDTKSQFLVQKLEERKKELGHKYGDHLTLLKIYAKYLKIKGDVNKLNAWSFQYFLKTDILHKASTYYKKIKVKTYDLFGEPVVGANVMDYKLQYRILAAIAFGFSTNMAYPQKETNTKVKSFPLGTLFSTSKVKNVQIGKSSWLKDSKDRPVVYNELFKVGKNAELTVCSLVPQKAKKLVEEFGTIESQTM